MARARIGRTLASDVHVEIRHEILNGTIAPSERIKLAETAQRFEVSQSVVRDALMQLARQGFVVAEPQLGFRVREVSPTDLEEVTAVRILMECKALELAVERGEVAWLTELVAAHFALSKTPMIDVDDVRGTTTEWADAHARFHNLLIEGCGNTRLAELGVAVRDSAEIYVQWSDSHRVHRDIAKEHRDIVDAVVAGDGRRAAGFLREHLQRTCDERVAYWYASRVDDLVETAVV